MKRAVATSLPYPSPLWAGQSHVDFFDSNLSPKAFRGFQNCASEAVWIRSLREKTKKKRHAIALPLWGGWPGRRTGRVGVSNEGTLRGTPTPASAFGRCSASSKLGRPSPQGGGISLPQYSNHLAGSAEAMP